MRLSKENLEKVERGIAQAKAGMVSKWQRNKFKAKRTTVDGIAFASRAEAARYCVLKLKHKRKEISGLELQPTFKFRSGITYKADFAYYAFVPDYTPNGGFKRMIEDVKGFKTDVYKLKKKLLKDEYGIEVQEIAMKAAHVNLILAAYTKGVCA